MDFGRITIAQDLILYLFGTPGQERFWFFWEELSRGAIGAVVLADVRRLDDAFAVIDFFEHRRSRTSSRSTSSTAPRCTGTRRSAPGAVGPGVGTPLLICDARRRDSSQGRPGHAAWSTP